MDLIDPFLFTFLLASGYLFLIRCHYMRFHAEGKEWERNLLETAFVGGAIFFLVKTCFIPLLIRLLPITLTWWQILYGALPFPHLGALLISMCVALVAASFINWRIPSGDAVRKAVEKYGGELLSLLHFAARTGRPVSLTMSNRKVYVGFIRATPTLRYPHTKILPTMSGFRDENSLNVKFDTNYWFVYESLEERRSKGESVIDIEHFGIVLPIEQICSANLFDEEAYQRYFIAQSSPPKKQLSQSPKV